MPGGRSSACGEDAVLSYESAGWLWGTTGAVPDRSGGDHEHDADGWRAAQRASCSDDRRQATETLAEAIPVTSACLGRARPRGGERMSSLRAGSRGPKDPGSRPRRERLQASVAEAIARPRSSAQQASRRARDLPRSGVQPISGGASLLDADRGSGPAKAGDRTSTGRTRDRRRLGERAVRGGSRRRGTPIATSCAAEAEIRVPAGGSERSRRIDSIRIDGSPMRAEPERVARGWQLRSSPARI